MANIFNHSNPEPLIPASQFLPEFTFKAIVISILLAVVLAASNAYLALKIGATVSASIPASVLALGILRFFRRSNVLESNLIQTAASAGEAIAAAIAFVLPGMIFLGIWKFFPYWETVVITLIGGLLGVLFSVPLRRVILSLPALRFPEGVAIGNVLRASTQGGQHLKLLIEGSLVGGLVSFLQMGLQLLASDLQLWMVTGRTIFGLAFGFTPATLAAGYIVGLEVAMSLFTGVVVGWIILLPLIGLMYGIPHTGTAYDISGELWSHYLRYVGVGIMLVGGVWTLLSLLKPIGRGLALSLTSLRTTQSENSSPLPRTERDIPLHWVFAWVIILLACLTVFLLFYLWQAQIISSIHFIVLITLCSVFYVLVIGFFATTISSYFCGLVGSSNNPVSGISITIILLLAFIYLLMFGNIPHAQANYIASAVIVIATILACAASVGGENIQDLKAGQMVGATPWKQQLMMAIGVVAAAFIIGPVLELLFHAYGIGGVYPRPGMDPRQMLAAPQAGLMTAVAQGVLTHHLNWAMIELGGGVAIVIIIVDTLLKRKNWRLPALAMGLGVYLPPEVTMPLVAGGVVSYLVKRVKRGRQLTPEEHQTVQQQHQQGVLMACGMVAGSALMGVLLAIPFVLMGSANALSVVSSGFYVYGELLAVIVFLSLCYWFYRIGRFKF